MIGTSKVLLAEQAMNALADSSFSNLFEMERYIAALSQSVILIVESPGSFCELGFFVSFREIGEKLIVVNQSQYSNIQSFIISGAVKYFKENFSSDHVVGFDWTVENKVVKAPDYVVTDFSCSVVEIIDEIHKDYETEQFDEYKIGHIIYLVLAFCFVLRAAKFTDIKNCFEWVGLKREEIELKRCLDTLLICGLLTAITKGKLTYFIANIDRIPLRIGFKEGTIKRHRDSLRWLVQIAGKVREEESFRIEMFSRRSVEKNANAAR